MVKKEGGGEGGWVNLKDYLFIFNNISSTWELKKLR